VKVTVIGGAGYVGTVLCEHLLLKGHEVTVLDTFWYGDHLSGKVRKICGDMRSGIHLRASMHGADAVIHLACISNDPSFEINPKLGREINLDTFPHVISELNLNSVSKFIYASSSSVYGVSEEPEVTEDVECRPLTDYSKYKLECEQMLKRAFLPKTKWTIVRPATVCGYSPRMRLDLVINAMAYSALTTGVITVNGGPQMRPNIHIEDLCRTYLAILESDCHQQTFNVGSENLSLTEIATMIAESLPDKDIKIVHRETNDPRSYRITSKKIAEHIKYLPMESMREAARAISYRLIVSDLPKEAGSRFYNIKRMKELISEGKV
jgi:nucleoside-diphosphate-sugar epimerase